MRFYIYIDPKGDPDFYKKYHKSPILKNEPAWIGEYNTQEEAEASVASIVSKSGDKRDWYSIVGEPDALFIAYKKEE